ncbi:MAG TPA: hypothetical protein VFN44_20365 [Solirubrobacteraceae bacterium]|nr:hypothetical protein [Solirubrobacteraceae bacterium]
MSDNLEYVTRMSDAAGITEGKFDKVAGSEILIVTGRFGFKSYDVSDPSNPVLLDSFMPPGVNPANGYWQDEDMELDTKRNLIIGALDPRHNESDPVASGCPDNDGLAVRDPDCRSGFFVISYSDPANLTQVGDFVSLPAGHTASCIQDCKYIWTGGPARRSDQGDLGPIIQPVAGPPSLQNRLIGDGRPIYAVDLRDPANPVISDDPIDTGRNDGFTDYSHDVDEDDRGIAWVAGRGGIRGYATSGKHRDPYTDAVREATPFDPVLVAGGGVAWDDPNVEGDDGTAQPVMLMHNSGRPTDGSVRADGVKKGNVLVGTEEDFTTTNGCGDSGRIVLSDITDSLGGEPASQSTREAPYRMKTLDSFHPFLDTPETANPNAGCSAHYFEIDGPMLGAAWYGQGLRLIDISDARDVEQVGYYRVTGTGTDNPNSNSWDVAFRPAGSKKAGDLIYLFDMSRGVEVLRLKRGTAAAAGMKAVTAPSLRSTRFAAKATSSLVDTGDPNRFVCPLFE